MGARGVAVLGLQYGLQSASLVANPSQEGELFQQEQLNSLTETLFLQTRQQHNHPPYHGPVICRRYHQPGHFSRDCEAEHTLPCPTSAESASSQLGMRQHQMLQDAVWATWCRPV